VAKQAPSWVTRLTAIENRFLDWARSPEAARVAEQPPTGSIEAFRGRKYCVLVTYKKDGVAVPSPLWFGIGDGKLYAHTAGAKVKRIERNPDVLVAPSTFRGKAVAAPIAGTARVVPAADADDAERWIQANYGPSRRVYYRLFGHADAGVYIEVTPAG
jgi:hypothetical protein